MVRKFLFLILFISILSLTSCGYVKLGTYTHERVDLGMEGNKGYLSGSAPAGPSTLDKPDRKVLQLEVTVPTLGEEEDFSTQPKAVEPERTISEPVYQPQTTPEKKSTPKIK